MNKSSSRIQRKASSIKLRSSGFTLIEMLIGIVIMGMAISMVSVSISQSVRNQERMQNLLGIYQVALTNKEQITERLRKEELNGEFQVGNINVNWQAQLLEQVDEGSVFIGDRGSFSQPMFVVNYYLVTMTVESPVARRIYQFEHMIEKHKSEVNSRFPGFPR